MIRGFKYRFYPTPEQEAQLARTFGAVRFIYNWALQLCSLAPQQSERRMNYRSLSAELTKLKRKPETAWLNEVSSVPTQQCLRHLQTAFVNFWARRTAYPAFKRKRGHQSAEFTRSAFKWRSGELLLAKTGRLKINWSRTFTAEPSTVTVSKTPAGRYYVAFRVDEPLPAVPKSPSAIGIDLGLRAFATTSTGLRYGAPRPLRRKMAQLRRAQKALSRKQKGSRNHTKARVRVARIHEKISDIRQDFLQKLTTHLVRENQTIVIEQLAVRKMMANHSVAGAVGDSGWSEFARQLDYKCSWYGRRLIRIDRFYPSTKRCSQCGHVVGSIAADARSWDCPCCGAAHDRDVNAAKNILAAGQAVIACGDGVRPCRPRDRGGSCR